MVESTSKLRKDVLAATGVDILEDDKKTFRSTYDILLDISKVWGDIDNEITKAAILEELAGKRNANALSAILNNGEMLKSVYDDAIDSSGVAIAEQQKWADSIEAKFSKIEGIFQSISANILSSDSFKNILDSLTSIMEKLESITNGGSGLIPIFTILSALMGATGKGIIDVSQFKSATSLINDYNKSLTQTVEKQQGFMDSIQKTNPSMYNYLSNLNGSQASMSGYASATALATVKTVGLRVAVSILNTVINGIIGLIASGLTTAIMKLINHEENLRREFSDSTEEMKSNIDALDDYKAKVLEVADSDKTEADKLKELGDIKDDLHDKYQTEISDLKDTARARIELTNAIEQQREKELNDYYREYQKQFAKQSEEMVKSKQGEGNTKRARYSSQSQVIDYGNAKNVREDIQNLFEDYGRLSETDGILGGITFKVEFGDSLNDYYQNLLNVSNRMSEIRSTTQNWSKDEEKIYKAVNKRIEDIKDEYYDENNLMENQLEFAKNAAERISLLNPRDATQSLEEWKISLENVAKSDKGYGEGIVLVVNAIDELVDSMIGAEEQTKKVDTAFLSLNQNLSKVSSQAEQVQASINTANEALEDLLKTVENNNDTDKFFSSSEIIDLLNKYPQLANSILETASGYKIEKKALDELRDSKIQEQKDAINAQLLETEALYNATEQKLEAYSQEMAAVKDLATAKLKLAEVENQLALNTLSNASVSGAARLRQANSVGNLINERDALQKSINYFESQKDLDEYKKKILSLKTQLDVLGKTHKNVKDDVKDHTDEINRQKDALKNLQDEMKKAQDDIEDLVELTMKMIMPKGKVRYYWKQW